MIYMHVQYVGKTNKTEQVDRQRSSSTEGYHVHKNTSHVGGNTKIQNKTEEPAKHQEESKAS